MMIPWLRLCQRRDRLTASKFGQKHLRGNVLPLNRIHDGFRSGFPQQMGGLVNGRQRGNHESGFRLIVITDQRNILGNTQSVLV